MRLGLVGRILIVGAVVVAFLLVEFALFIGVVHGLRREADRQVELQEIVTESVEQAAALARQKQLELRTEIGQVPPLSCARERIAEVVANLLSNVVKFTPPGGRVVVRLGADGHRAFGEVEDTGIGIPQAERAHHGTITGESGRGGVGTCFRFDLPLAAGWSA